MTVHTLPDRKWCSACNSFKPLEGGQTKVIRNRYKRWMCKTCATRTNLSGFK